MVLIGAEPQRCIFVQSPIDIDRGGAQQQQFPEEVAVDSDSGIKFQISDTNKNKKMGPLTIKKSV